LLTFLGACKKVSRRQAKPPAAATEATDIHPKPNSLVGPKAATTKKKPLKTEGPKKPVRNPNQVI
jgi:hypothetical protein